MDEPEHEHEWLNERSNTRNQEEYLSVEIVLIEIYREGWGCVFYSLYVRRLIFSHVIVTTCRHSIKTEAIFGDLPL